MNQQFEETKKELAELTSLTAELKNLDAIAANGKKCAAAGFTTAW